MAYKSPIDIIHKQIRIDVDNAIYGAVLNAGINVDREELIKALRYDRGQYDKGYDNGRADMAREIENVLVNYVPQECIDEIIKKLEGNDGL